MPDFLKDFLLHKLTLRLIYIAGAYLASHAVSLVALPQTQAVLVRSGVSVTINDPDKLRTSLMLGLMMGGEFIFHFVHNKFILPHVNGVSSEVSKI